VAVVGIERVDIAAVAEVGTWWERSALTFVSAGGTGPAEEMARDRCLSWREAVRLGSPVTALSFSLSFPSLEGSLSRSRSLSLSGAECWFPIATNLFGATWNVTGPKTKADGVGRN